MAFFIFSCKKDNADEIKPNQESTETTINFSTPHPTMNHGMLKFESREHIQSYYAELNNYVYGEMKDFDSDSLLTVLENQLNFPSLRPILDPSFTLANVRVNDEDFLLDELRMTLLNEDYEVQIGDEIFIYYSENQVLVIDESDELDREFLKLLPKGDDTKIPSEILTKNIRLESNKHKLIKEKYMLPSSVCEAEFSCGVSPAACIPGASYIGANVHVNETSDEGTPNNPNDDQYYYYAILGDWTIDWGDGQLEEVEGVSSIGLLHNYSEYGEYHITVYFESYDFDCGSITQSFTETIDCGFVIVGANNCQVPNESTTIIDDNNGSNYRMVGELWFKHDIFGNHEVARTISQHFENPWNGPEGWYRKRAYIYAKLWYDFRDENCNYPGGDDMGTEIDAAGNKKTIRAGKTYGGSGVLRYVDELVHSFHEMENNGNNRTGLNVLQACE